jgi:tRNA nucleotidyltransferase (CCA-adding enzyme)
MEEIMRKFRPHALKIKELGGTLYIVGGAVRDTMLLRKVHDFDFCVTGLTISDFVNIFPTARIQGKSFPVFVLDGCEVALARTERKCGIGYKGFEINANPEVTIEEDLGRRDLSINAMAAEVLHGTLIDPYGGAKDLEHRNIRPTSVAFIEDPVRVLRAARFAAELDFGVSTWVMVYSHDLKPELHTINDNMKFTEMKKALMGIAPHRYFEVLRLAGVLDVVFPELSNLEGVPQAHHEDGDAYEHTMAVLTKCRELTSDPVLLYAAITHDLGKGTTPVEAWPTHHDHENRSVELVDQIDWVPNEYKSFARAFAYDHMRAHRYQEMRRGRKVSLLERISKSNRGIDGFCTVLLADKPTEETMKTIIKMKADYAKIMTVTGNDVPVSTPKDERFGQVLHQLRSEKICC